MNINEIIRKLSDNEDLSLTEKSDLEVFLRNKSKYGLNWMEVPEIKKVGDEEFEINDFLKKNKPYIKYNKELSLKGEGNNLLIEGDNYEALMALLPIYEKSIDVIYIDPPYNTGSKDFLYNDKYSTSDDDDFHSRWLSFMEKRIKLAYKLLKQNGYIFISINDKEKYNLKLLIDSIFNESNFIQEIVVKSSDVKGNKVKHAKDGKRFPSIKESLLVYSKSKENRGFLDIPKSRQDKWNKEYSNFCLNMTKKDKNELLKFKEKKNPSFKEIKKIDDILKNINYENINTIMKKNKIKNKDVWLNENAWRIFRLNTSPSLTKLSKSKDSSHQFYSVVSTKGNTFFVKNMKGNDSRNGRVHLMFASENLDSYLSDCWMDISYTGLQGEVPKGQMVFNNGQKPIGLLHRILNLFPKEKIVVLDFFGGSGSTAHASMIHDKNIDAIICTDNTIPLDNYKLAARELSKDIEQLTDKDLIPYGICRFFAYRKLSYFAKQSSKSLRYFNLEYFKKAPRGKTKKNLNKIIINLLMVKENCYQIKKERKDYSILYNTISDKKVIVIKDSEGIELETLKVLIKENKESKFYINECIGIEKYIKNINYELIPEEFYKIYKNIEENI